MEKVLVVGDVHGEFGYLNALISRKKPDVVICCGDFGYWPKFNEYRLSKIRHQGAKILFCDGNHEDHWALRDRDSDELAPGIFYMPRGSIYTLEDGRRVMFFGGADSIDKSLRTVGVDWFPEETITQRDMMSLPDTKVDIFITHTCPEEIVPALKSNYPDKGLEPSNVALTELWKIYVPELWFFGHWHQFANGDINNYTKWFCLSAAGFGDRWWMWLKT